MCSSPLTALSLRTGLILAAALGLGGCEELAGGGDGAAASGGGSESVLRVEERDVERPDIYELAARGLWDGRPSLGGRWVAVRDDINADRVRITNLDNDRQIEGALFKVEEGRPGPPIMVSSEAAEPLGMLPGAPARLHVVVVRTEQIEVLPEPGEAPPADTEEDGDGTAVAAAAGTAAAADAAVTPLSTEALETSVLDALDGSEPAPTPEPEPAPAPEPPAPAAQDELNALVAAAQAPTGIGGDLQLPYLQVASGSDRAAAEAAVKKLNDAGYGARIRESTSDAGAAFFRVVAGPFGNEGGRRAALGAIRKLGYTDAFPVK